MRIFTMVNLVLWCVLFVAWLPYLSMVGIADRVSTEVVWILAVTALLQAALFALRLRNRRPVLG